MYKLEEYLVNDFISCLLESPFSTFGDLKITREFDYKQGRVDIIALAENEIIIAFEAKLKKWREALHQAYRNTCFANYSFIVVPEETAKKASIYYAEFSRRSVGICYISNNHVVIEHDAKEVNPFQIWISEKAKEITLREDTLETIH